MGVAPLPPARHQVVEKALAQAVGKTCLRLAAKSIRRHRKKRARRHAGQHQCHKSSETPLRLPGDTVYETFADIDEQQRYRHTENTQKPHT